MFFFFRILGVFNGNFPDMRCCWFTFHKHQDICAHFLPPVLAGPRLSGSRKRKEGKKKKGAALRKVSESFQNNLPYLPRRMSEEHCSRPNVISTVTARYATLRRGSRPTAPARCESVVGGQTRFARRPV